MNVADEKKSQYLKNEIAAFESRLTGIKAELDSLRKQKEVLVADIDDDKKRHNADVAQKQAILRQEQTALDEGRLKLENAKKEFEKVLQEFQSNKNLFERERQSSLDLKSDAQKTMDRATAFFVAIRNEAAKL